jgi:hypothetical protein
MAFAGRLLAAGTSGPKEMEERTNPQDEFREQSLMSFRYEVRERED